VKSVLDFLRRFRKKEAPPEPGSLARELWDAELVDSQKGRFAVLSQSDYEASYAPADGGSRERDSLELRLKRSGLFAWTEADLYRYDDFAFEGKISFPSNNPYSSAGFLFRYTDEGNFYALLASNRGAFRLDAVFNGRPRTLVGWTEIPSAANPAAVATAERSAGEETASAPESRIRIGAIVRGSGIIILVDGEWVAEVVDETHRSGILAFAAQYFPNGSASVERDNKRSNTKTAEGKAKGPSAVATVDEVEKPARFFLEGFRLESRPVEVEANYLRISLASPPAPESRFRFAETLFAQGEWLPASVQIRKIERARTLEAPEAFLKAEAAIRLGLLAEAEEALNLALELDARKPEYLLEKANLLYLGSRYLELRDFALPLLDAAAPEFAVGVEAKLRLLLGHALFNLGDYASAAAEYALSSAAEPGQAIIKMCEARSREASGDKGGAAEAYLAAARGFYENDAEHDFSLALGRLLALKPRNPEVLALKAKSLFRQGKKPEAERLIEALIGKGSTDSALHYLAGILRSEKGKRAAALETFTKALELDSDYALYAFRRAECLYLLKREPESKASARIEESEIEAAVKRALELGPEDGWILNLAGQRLLESDKGEKKEARRLLEAAVRALPDKSEPAINLAELESLEGRLDAALACLEAFPDDAAARNQAGNALARASKATVSASDARDKASAHNEATDRSELSDSAATAIAREEAAEGLLERAAREYRKALAIEPGKAEYEANLAAVLLEQERYSEAEEHIRKALDAGTETRAYLLAGNLGLVYGDRVRAEAAFRVGLEAVPNDPPLLLALGRLYLTGGKAKKAAENAKLLDKADPARASVLYAEIRRATTESIACDLCGRTWELPKSLPAQSAASIRGMPPDEAPAGSCPRCGKIYCIACRKDKLSDSRFTCPDCSVALKLSDNRLKWLVRSSLEEASRLENRVE